ncbi:aspartate--tRNA ligase [bacterium]|nr:aspartate--tRNA ligase [bacterium]
MRILSDQLEHQVGKKVEVAGWVQTRRDHGGLIFIDLRDHKGLLQLVIHPDKKDVFKIAEDVRDEYVLKVIGEVKKREDGLENDKIASGKVELVVEELEVLNKSEALPIQPFSENQSNEELRLKYRYLDLRRPIIQDRLRTRAKFNSYIRDFMEKNEFTEVTTPIIANSSPEGARDFLIPSRVHPGKFYALPQAPQQFKQLLMVGGVNRYYQLAACFRDEDPRSDRLYGEFYQLDLEMSFVYDGEEVRKTVEPLITNLVTDFAGKKLLFKDVPRIPYAEAMNKYGSDKPDLRFGMELVDLTSTLKDSGFAVFGGAIKEGGVVKAINVKGGAKFSRSDIDKYTEIAKDEGAKGLAYVLYDKELKSPILKFLSETEIKEIEKLTDFEDGDALFFAADKLPKANAVLGKLRNTFGTDMKLKDPNLIALAWITDFPFYEWDEKANKLDFGHNPFSMPKNGMKALEESDPTKIIADQYDMVMNGYEICSGGVRNHNPEIMYKVFEKLNFSKEYVDSKFGAMINAFKFGAPPHAGCAFGVDRIFMVLINEDNIREVVAFPKNGSGVDLMMDSPSIVDQNQLNELHIKPKFD